MEFYKKFKKAIGQNLDNDPEDIIKAEKALKDAGYFNGEHSHGFITKELDDGIRKFQRENGLKQDGVMHPDGETERILLRNIPVPQRKPKQKDGEDVFEKIKERVKVQKKLVDFIKKGMKKGPLFLYDLQKRAQEIRDEKSSGPI